MRSRSLTRSGAVRAAGTTAAVVLCLGAIAGVVAGALAGPAVAASQSTTRFVGSGVDYLNNAPRWTAEGAHSRITFRVVGGRRLVDFHATYFYYCGDGTGSIVTRPLAIGAHGRFHIHGSFLDHASGKVTGRSYVALAGHLTDHGAAATLSFLVDTVFTGGHVTARYSTRIKPAESACETWVKGGARATTGGHQTKPPKKGGSQAAIAGDLYIAHPFQDDPFELRVLPGAHQAKFVGSFNYTDPGCKSQPFGNEYLTASNAPLVTIAKDGKFTGRKVNGAYLDVISGTFKGTRAVTTFTETIANCAGDKPQVFSFTMHAQPAASSSRAASKRKSGRHVYSGSSLVAAGSPVKLHLSLDLSATRSAVSSLDLTIPVGCGTDGAGVTVGGPRMHVRSQGPIAISGGQFSTTQTGMQPMPFASPAADGQFSLKISGKLGDHGHRIRGRLTYEIKQGGHYCTASATATGALRSSAYAVTET